jgi:hypothetical protein
MSEPADYDFSFKFSPYSQLRSSMRPRLVSVRTSMLGLRAVTRYKLMNRENYDIACSHQHLNGERQQAQNVSGTTSVSSLSLGFTINAPAPCDSSRVFRYACALPVSCLGLWRSIRTAELSPSRATRGLLVTHALRLQKARFLRPCYERLRPSLALLLLLRTASPPRRSLNDNSLALRDDSCCTSKH